MHWGWYWKIKLRHTHKKLCSRLLSLDSFAMFRNKELVDLCKGNVAYEVSEYALKAVLLDQGYQVTYNSGSYMIPIETQRCHFGGLRYFFRCPQCNQRMRLLYCDAGKFSCRKCLNLCYYTQLLRPSRRCLAMADKIKTKLQNRAGDLDQKPPWMKKKTFKAAQRQHAEYYNTKFIEAHQTELLKYYPKWRNIITSLF